jgi:hypothetical protein
MVLWTAHVLLQQSMYYELIWAEFWCRECGETAKSPPRRGAIGNVKGVPRSTSSSLVKLRCSQGLFAHHEPSFSRPMTPSV